MELSDDSDDSDDGPHYSSMKQPPLIKQLKKILDEYPDDGQILKEIIQNAEDAEASEMEILYDGRRVNQNVGKKDKPFRKYFRGPALCVYNNAEFTEEDWEGIQMINSSVKEFDPVKIGRFGLGFKSVFHITDYPMIISKNRMLILDPHQTTPERVCILMKLKKIRSYTKEVDLADCLTALDGIFGFSQGTLDSGNFTGTLFRFPLRDEPTKLSDNIYDEEKIVDLFKAFKTEASVELLFLKCLEKISLVTRDADELYCREVKPAFTVKLSHSCITEVRKKRKDLHSHMKTVGNKLADADFKTSFKMKVITEDIMEEQRENEWLVMHCLKGGIMSRELKNLSQDESLSYSPYVGIALPLIEEPNFKGHVFCLMPLPLEDESLTGLPVHVNGYFALSQNRRHVKWPTADQTKNKTHTDKAIRWNRCLVIEVLADVYFSFLEQLIQICKDDKKLRGTISLLYRCIPDHNRTTNHWELILNPLYSRLLQSEFLFTENNGGKWITSAKAVFNIFKEDISNDFKDTILRLMRVYNVDLVHVPDHIVSLIQFRDYAVQRLTPKFVVKFLKTDSRYKQMNTDEKINILQFLLSGKNSSQLSGLELLPLENGAFGVFGKRDQVRRVMVCREESQLFPSQEECFCRQGLQHDIYKSLYEMAENGDYQLCTFGDLTSDEIVSLLQATITKRIGKTSDRALHWKTSEGNVTGKKWLVKVWKLLQRYDLHDFSTLHLVPYCQPGKKDILFKISTKFLLRSHQGYSDLSTSLCNALNYLEICTVDTLPKVILEHDDIYEYIYFPTTSSVFKMLEFISSNRNCGSLIQQFNKKSTVDDRRDFATFLGRESLTSSVVRNVVSKLEIFKEKNGGKYVSSNQVKIITDTNILPVKYHKKSLDCEDRHHESLAMNLGVTRISQEDIIVDILTYLQKGIQYSHGDMNNIMSFVMNNLNKFSNKQGILNIAKTIRFVPNARGQMKRAIDLFDPEDETLNLVVVDNDCFPNVLKCPVSVKQLRKLGLKSVSDLNAEDLLNCAKYIESKSHEEASTLRSSKLLGYFQRNPSLLRSRVEKFILSDQLSIIHFINPSKRKESYPCALPWFNVPLTFCRPRDVLDPKYCNLIGSVQPVLETSVHLDVCNVFGWKRKPSIQKVIDQLFVVISRYEDQYKPQLLPLISEIYHFLAERNDVNCIEFGPLRNAKWIWTGYGFDTTESVIMTSQNDDISLIPYLYPLPSEFRVKQLQQFFMNMNCIRNQNAELLVRVLYTIRDKYENGYESEIEAKIDLQLVIKILNNLKDTTDKDLSDILIPVHTYQTGKIVLKPVTECNYCNDDWLKGAAEEEGDNIYYVHEDVSKDTAIKLGVPSLTDRLLEFTEGIDEWGQSEPLTRRIKNLLQDYKDGLSVPKEIVQNADDAGATKVSFMFDERENENFKTKLLNDKMASCQGPALWAYNNAVFTQKDLENITKLSGATKETDSSKVGKFGLGFCSVYNLTEVPSFVTGNHIVIFDPHTKYLGPALRNKNQPGIKIDIRKNQTVLKRMSSQFEPFNGVFGCNLSSEKGSTDLNGTLFRFPLRTEQQIPSDISNTVYNREEMISLMRIFVQACGTLLMFTQNVNEIEFYHLPGNKENPSDALLLFSVHKTITHKIERPFGKIRYEKETFSILKETSVSLEEAKHTKHKTFVTVNTSILQEISVRISTNLDVFEIDGESSNSVWMVTWASGTERSKILALNSSKTGTLPLGSVACLVQNVGQDVYQTCDLRQSPLGFYRTSHVFCYLPLPIETQFPLYINGSFAVSSDRRRLSCKTTDDKGSFESEWNDALLTDAVCNAYITFLEHLNHLKIDKNEHYYRLWPVHDTTRDMFSPLKSSFYRIISDEKKELAVFRGKEKVVCLRQCRILDPVLMDKDFADQAFELCTQHLETENTTMVRMPKIIERCFRVVGCDASIKNRILSITTFYSTVVFPHLDDDTWDMATKNKFILYAIDASNSSEELFELLKMHNCIPTSPNQHFRRPCDLVDENGPVGPMFATEDSRFIDSSELGYFTPERISALCKLGMNSNKLPAELLMDRARSIHPLQFKDLNVAKSRCCEVMKYINKESSDIMQNPDILRELKNIKFLPVKRKPTNWKWKWGADRQYDGLNDDVALYTFACPLDLYSESVWKLVCCSQAIVDRECFSSTISTSTLEMLGVATENSINLKMVLENLRCLCKTAANENSSGDLDILNQVTMAAYKYIDKIFKGNVHDEEQLEHMYNLSGTFINENIVLLNGIFVKPCQLVMHLSEDCSPYLHGLNTAVYLKALKGFVKLFRIEDTCPAKTVISVLTSLNSLYGSKPLSDDALQIYVRLLKVLVDSGKREKLTKDTIRDLLIPDTKGILTPTSKLCVDEVNVSSMEAMKFTHPTISFEMAFALGINSKREQKIEECSKPIEIYSKDFGQQEKLVTRIKRILSGYPCDVGVLKELLQNADDAKASELHIVLDFCQHETDNLFADSWKPLQGPSLLVYNDSYFSETDIKGIQNLGIGSKGEDPTKTGQYGVGFNAVYHLTDVPSFLTRGPNVDTGELLCVMDPHYRFVPNATAQNPGRQYIRTDVLKEDYPAVFACYRDNLLMKEKGTIFRLPLRTLDFASMSQISPKDVNETTVRNLISNFKDELMDILLFVNNVKTVRISEVVGDQLNQLYAVNVQLTESDECKRKQFYKDIETKSRKIHQMKKPNCVPPSEAKYMIDVCDSLKTEKKWLIVRRIGFSGKQELPEIVLKAYDGGDLGVLPRGGVAVQVSDSQHETNGRAFCFLPLPLETGLPVHINGHFVLDHEARRNLWTEENETYRSVWNKYVMSDIIAPSYASALLTLQTVIGLTENIVLKETEVHQKLQVYHTYWPEVSKGINAYFKFLALSVYRWIDNTEQPLFPNSMFVGNTEMTVRFYPIICSEMSFPCVFNTFSNQSQNERPLETISSVTPEINQRLVAYGKSVHASDRNESETKNQNIFIRICKDLGVRLLDTPLKIILSLKEAGVAVTEMSPGFFISFLKSFDSTDSDKCQIDTVDKEIKTTKFKSVENVVICLKYCLKSTDFDTEVDGLPLCLTGDCVLRVFKEERPVFSSKFCHMLKESSHVFLHFDLAIDLSPETVGLKPLDIVSFSELLYHTLQAETYRTHNAAVVWEPDDLSVPNKYWLETVWNYLNSAMVDEIEKHKDNNAFDSKEIIKTFLNPLLPWCLVPCTQFEDISKSTKCLLFPMDKMAHVLDISTFTGDMVKSLTKLSFPCLHKPMTPFDSIILKNMIARQDSPESLLNFLYYNRDIIAQKNLNVADCYEIMGFISEHLDTIIKQSDESIVVDKIKSIPLHVNMNKHGISILGQSSVLVLDSYVSQDIVPNGIEQWALQSGTILLKTSSKLKTLYAKLGLTSDKLKAIHVYTQYLLPRFDCMPREFHVKHLKHIQDNLLATSFTFNDDQQKLIAILKNVEFVPDKQGILYKASHFKSPFNNLMMTMCQPEDFPAEQFMNRSWQYLLENAGIQKDVTKDMVVQFARIIEHNGRHGVTEDVRNKSNMLVVHIFGRTGVEKENILRQVNSIRFIVPFEAGQWKRDIHNQLKDNMVCYSMSVPQSQEDLSWTTCSILPNYANPQQFTWLSNKVRNQILDQLQIHKEPQFSDVVKHTQNICDSLKLLADRKKIQDGYVMKIQEVMVKLYMYLNGNKEKNSDHLKTSLSQKPIVFLPNCKQFLNCDRLVKSLQIQQEIKPYLMEVPEEYGAYFKLFELLGMKTRPNICNFIRVLKYLKIDVGEEDLNLNDLKIVQRALQQICNHLQCITEDHVTELSTMDALFLPTRNKILSNARSIVLSDNKAYEEKVGNAIGMPYMVDLMDLEINVMGNIVLDFKKLPQKLQPNILSDMITKEFDEDSLTITFDDKGKQLADFMTSTQFMEAVVRIAVHSSKKNNFIPETKKVDVDKIISSIGDLQIRQVDSIRLKLVFQSTTVGFSERSCYFFPKANDANVTQHILLCAFKDKLLKNWLMKNCTTIGHCLMTCTENEFHDTDGLLFKIFHYIDRPDSISKALDEEEVPQYSVANKCKSSIFPPAGTTVHPDWYCYLDNSFSDFDVDEYVALLLNEETIEGDAFTPALYIYAIIKQKCEAEMSCSILERLHCLYKVDVGVGRIERRNAFDLYKFNRKPKATSTDLAPFLDIADSPKDDRSLCDILKEVKEIIKAAWTLPEDERKKIIKRLYFKWHPDKNRGNEDVTTKVFQFIQQTVFKMENGQNIDDETSDHFEPPKDSYFRSHFRTWDRGAKHSNRGRRRGGRGHSSGSSRRQPKEPVPSHHEGKQWMKQAKIDLAGATEFLPHAQTGPNFNLICLICYQSVEKALKAMHYVKDSNGVPDINLLQKLAQGLDEDIRKTVDRLIVVVGKPEQMMYPDRLNIPKIPSDLYNRTTATKAMDEARKIIELVSDRM